MVSLSKNLKRRMIENRLTALALSRLSGLKITAIYNITSGKSSNPTLYTLQALSDALGCTMDELVNDNIVDIKDVVSRKTSDYKAFVDTLTLVSSFLQNKNIRIKRAIIYRTIEDIYRYSLKKNKETVDMDFAEWKLEDTLSQKTHL